MASVNRELLVAACNGRRTDVDHALSEGADIDHMDDDGLTALRASILNKQTRTVEHLLNLGANPNVGIDPPLCSAAAQGLVAIARLLATHKNTDVNARNCDNFTALHVATELGNVQITELLVANGAAVNALGNGNVTPLHFAAQNGHTMVAALLLKNGARVDVVSIQGETARDSAERNGHRDLVTLLEKAVSTSRVENSRAGHPLKAEDQPPEVLDVEWDDDCIRYVHQQRCHCGRFWTMKDYHRRSGIDVIECHCPECNSRREFAFRPMKIHTSVAELIRENRQYVRM